MRLAVIPARGGSKRIKNKNIIDFHGRPMISYPLTAARDSGLFDVIHVSTDDPAIKAVVEGLGHPVPFLRAPELADDHTGLMPVLRWVVEQFRGQGRTFETIALILPCAPLIEASDLLAAHGLFTSRTPRHVVMAVAPFPVPVEWAYILNADHSLTPVNPGAYAIRSQDLGKKYYDTGTFYFYSAEHVAPGAPEGDGVVIAYPLPRSKAVDIDDYEDLELAAALFTATRRGSADPGQGGGEELPRALGFIAEERRLRMESRRANGAEADPLFFHAVESLPDQSTAERLRQAHAFAKKLPYHHPGLTPAAYLAHPIRLALMALRMVRPFEAETGIVALLHNVLEVSDTTPGELRERFGEQVCRTIGNLTVDRSRNDVAYKKEYYGRLSQGSRTGRIVKVLDKLDNLFLLCLNPDDSVREGYIREIEEFLVPLARSELPELVSYLRALCEDNRRIGYQPMDRATLDEGKKCESAADR